MKKLLFVIGILLVSFCSSSQKYFQGSLRKNPDPAKNQVEIVFKPSYKCAPGEYINFLQFAIAISLGDANEITAVATGVNTFSNMDTLTNIPAYTETYGTPSTADDERVFGWVFANPVTAKQSWDAGKDFTGVVVTLNKNIATVKVKLLNLTNIEGGINMNTYFAMVSNTGDVANYDNLFFEIKGSNHMGSNEKTGDQFVQTPGFRKE